MGSGIGIGDCKGDDKAIQADKVSPSDATAQFVGGTGDSRTQMGCYKTALTHEKVDAKAKSRKGAKNEGLMVHFSDFTMTNSLIADIFLPSSFCHSSVFQATSIQQRVRPTKAKNVKRPLLHIDYFGIIYF